MQNLAVNFLDLLMDNYNRNDTAAAEHTAIYREANELQTGGVELERRGCLPGRKGSNVTTLSSCIMGNVDFGVFLGALKVRISFDHS